MPYKCALCLVVGLIIGIRLTDFWDYFKLQANVSQQQQQLYQQSQNHASLLSSIDLPSFLYNSTRVVCIIITTPENHLKRALHVKNTWGTRCNKLLFMSSEEDRYLNTIKLPVLEGRENLWPKTREAFKFVYDKHFEDAEWFLKADDDTYVIMENLRMFLYQFSPSAPVYFGCKFYPFVKQGYMSGGAGYVLSKEGLRRFALDAYPNPTLCSKNQLSEDKEMGICLENVGVIAGDSRDENGRERFLPLAPTHLIPFDTSEWYSKYLFYKWNKSLACCASRAISFHYIKPKDFYIFDYFVYNLRPFGVDNINSYTLPQKANMKDLMKKWQRETSNNIIKD